jgi:hypothetical protein
LPTLVVKLRSARQAKDVRLSLRAGVGVLSSLEKGATSASYRLFYRRLVTGLLPLTKALRVPPGPQRRPL